MACRRRTNGGARLKADVRHHTYAMGHIVYSQVIGPGSVDLSWMIGRRIAEVSFEAPVSWTFYFGEKGYINVDCPWRVLDQGRTAWSSADHGQQYGWPA